MDLVEAAASGLDPDADVGFWSMSPASAEQVTVQIRTVLDRAWEFIALAYKGRAFIALGYPNWDAYVDARFGDLRIAVPREHRTQVVAELAGVRMSCRAIAKVLGVGVATVHRELTRILPRRSIRNSGQRRKRPGDRAGREGVPAAPAALNCRRATCSTCGEHHPELTGGCPWDLFAQGLAPHPHGGSVPGGGPGRTPPTARRTGPIVAQRDGSGRTSSPDGAPGHRRRTHRQCLAANGSRGPHRFGGSAGRRPGGGVRARRRGPGHRGREPLTSPLKTGMSPAKPGSAGSAMIWNARRPVGPASRSGWGWWPTHSGRAHDRLRAGRG